MKDLIQFALFILYRLACLAVMFLAAYYNLWGVALGAFIVMVLSEYHSK